MPVALALMLISGTRAFADPPTSAQAARFDAVFQRLDAGEIAILDLAQVEQRLDELARLRPPGDTRRDLRYRALRCDWGFPDDTLAARAYAEDGVQRAVRAADTEAQIRFRYCRGNYHPEQAQALADYDAGIALSRQTGNLRLQADGLSSRGSVRSQLGEHARAVLDILAAQRLYERAGRRNDAESNLFTLATAYRRMGDLDKALEYLKQSEAFARRSGDWNVLQSSLVQQAYLQEEREQPDTALALYQRALVLAQRQASAYDIGAVHLGMAYSFILKREFARALQALDRAQAEFASARDTSDQDMIDLRRGQAHAGLGQHARALVHYDRAVASLERNGNLRYVSMSYQARAASHEALGNASAALADLKRHLEAREKIADNNRDQQAELLRYQFDVARRDLENQQLQAEKAAKERQVAALLAARRWQWTALGLGALLLALFVSRHLRRLHGLQAMAMTDTLTGVANRRRIERFGHDAVEQALANQSPVTVLTVDIDRFKDINDNYGHQAGDQVLIRVAKACQGALRQFDLLGRVGGEEFLVVLPQTTLEQGIEVAERLRSTIVALPLADIAPGLNVTISVGVAAMQADDSNLKDLLRRADKALYRAKENGRNRVEVDAHHAPIDDVRPPRYA
ncbi:MAG TPA: diguanylate cyclase [Lysobacter sp.]